MRIQTIEITNYKAFFGTHKINVGGKNLFVYGENGSGKSSLYYALKDFFQSSVEEIDLNDTSIRDGNCLKSFLTYKHLLAVHHLKKDDSINLFDLLVTGVLQHFKYSLTNGKELGELWAEVEECIDRKTGKEYPINKKRAGVNGAIKRFNEAFGELFKKDSPEYILKHARPIIDKFNHNIALKLRFSQIRPSADYTSLEDAEVGVEISYAGKPVKKPHLFLNEARLSAIAISIYLGMIKRHVQGIPCKVLFLDDIFIGSLQPTINPGSNMHGVFLREDQVGKHWSFTHRPATKALRCR
ncbi:MAG: AAA family ATPase [Desulfosarcina sp.]|nr:AAA family ATPase [Desulfosarcina sp.]MBC2767759.1 AAA family ATPase [Desulfosarcina sp.]